MNTPILDATSRARLLLLSVMFGLLWLWSACGDDAGKQDDPDSTLVDTDASDTSSQPEVEPADTVETQEDLAMEVDLVDDSADIVDPCGNGVVDSGEDCDDGNNSNDDLCLTDCTFACGDGQLQSAEKCDTGIPAGQTGACPATCTPIDACSPVTLSGTGCLTRCVSSAIVGCIGGDSCCPGSCDASNDSDCTAVCGNNVVEVGETCDPAGSCPTACPDLDVCTPGTLSGAAAQCTSECSYDTVTTCVSADGCCPSACTSGTDSDCSATCGNNIIDGLETCDPPGSCPTTCADADACTTDRTTGSLANCNVNCSHQPIVTCVSNDGCCPSLCNSVNDNDCQAETIVFRPSEMYIRDPHLYLDVLIFGCLDMTDQGDPLGVSGSLNSLLNDSIQADSNGGGVLDLSLLLLFRPLNQAATTPLRFDFGGGTCTAPMATTVCDVNPTLPLQTTTYLNGPASGQTACLGALAGTTSNYSPSVTEATAPCFSSDTVSLKLSLGGIDVPLEDAQVSGTYMGQPATSITNGLLRGFISEASADATILPSNVPIVGGQPLSMLLAGGATSCATGDDRDVGSDGTTVGWWFYLNFDAVEVQYVGP
ncbi:MAG: hypothetical protein AUK47_22470 [Deltaproteobacteria bacterium CG2_30_63_29]|nr:MAG: hypothetical protein AUK47_22470 [Deltaproteobacteria bacterium CG2_30_63_29]PIV98534.1 MAG: hypothetical protein COW42_14120 [Deltaproteobacteria bacterium CG17_big_fil_post_rev_8_21_14_2_50_63_7]PJB40864.1 MAG: hypothetical protein CO108_13935 [Deltaproteobacteria bacterium CG_4_9_14_3_um_filter_63_12]